MGAVFHSAGRMQPGTVFIGVLLLTVVGLFLARRAFNSWLKKNAADIYSEGWLPRALRDTGAKWLSVPGAIATLLATAGMPLLVSPRIPKAWSETEQSVAMGLSQVGGGLLVLAAFFVVKALHTPVIQRDEARDRFRKEETPERWSAKEMATALLKRQAEFGMVDAELRTSGNLYELSRRLEIIRKGLAEDLEHAPSGYQNFVVDMSHFSISPQGLAKYLEKQMEVLHAVIIQAKS